MSEKSDRRQQRPHCNLSWHETKITPEQRERVLGQAGCVVWLTGLSGAGKSTLAVQLDQSLYKRSYHSYVLDGDNIRHTLCADLGFSAADREENIRRIAQVARLFSDAGLICITAFISPFGQDRQKAREIVREGRFFEIFVDTPLDVCEQRDPKGLYKKARQGEISNFTGISSPYEVPENANLIVRTAENSLGDCVDSILDYLTSQNVLLKP